jgi:hypothetical protein
MLSKLYIDIHKMSNQTFPVSTELQKAFDNSWSKSKFMQDAISLNDRLNRVKTNFNESDFTTINWANSTIKAKANEGRNLALSILNDLGGLDQQKYFDLLIKSNEVNKKYLEVAADKIYVLTYTFDQDFNGFIPILSNYIFNNLKSFSSAHMQNEYLAYFQKSWQYFQNSDKKILTRYT